MIANILGNGLWTFTNTAAYIRYRRALRNPRRAQEEILRRFLRRNADSEYGRRYGYPRIRTVKDFQSAVPIVTYGDLEPWIEKVRQGQPQVFTTEPVLFMEKSSGSSSAAKYIPYTTSLLNEFRRAIGTWMFDVFTGRPSLLYGAQYWAISPVARRKEVTPGGLTVGIEDDTEYLGTVARQALRMVLAVPASVCRVQDMEENRRITLQYLIQCRNLRFISVWNPSFLTLLMSRLPAGRQPLEYWPHLKLISCWTSANSARFVGELRQLFPGVEVQGKGLLATEGIVSFPELGHPAPSPALTSHFLEFVDEDAPLATPSPPTGGGNGIGVRGDGEARLVDELEVGRRYRVLITTGGGFARYSLGDVVEVVAPGAIEFVGKADLVSDVCGEKLDEMFVGRILEEASANFSSVGFVMLAPEWSRPPHYILFVESDEDRALADHVERLLRASVHYDYCRRLGQLGPVKGIRVHDGAARYLKRCVALGQRPGNVKAAYLGREFGWRDWLDSEKTAPVSPATSPLLEACHGR
jgi:hypothetical protein